MKHHCRIRMLALLGLATTLALYCGPGKLLAGPATQFGLYNTGVGDDQLVLEEDDIDPHYELTEDSNLFPDAFVTTSAGGFPVPPWLGDNNLSAWITPSLNTNGPGDPEPAFENYIFRTTFNLTEPDLNGLEINGRWTSDNTGLDIYLNGISLGIPNGGQFTAMTNFTLDREFVVGENTLEFLVWNAFADTDPPDGNPAGIRVEFEGNGASTAPPIDPSAFPSLYNTGVDDDHQTLWGNTASDPHYVVIGPDEVEETPLTVPNGFPIPPWIPNNDKVRWISPPSDGAATREPGDYFYETTFDMTGRDPGNFTLVGRWSTDDTGQGILLNGTQIQPWTNPVGFGGSSVFVLTPDIVEASGGEVNSGENTLTFWVQNGGADPNPTGLRVEIDRGLSFSAPEGTARIPGLFATGVADDGLALPDSEPDPHYTMTVFPDEAIDPAVALSGPPGAWIANTPISRWIGPDNDAAGQGPAGDYEFEIQFDMTGLDPATAVIEGLWTSDNVGSDILLNGVPTGNGQTGNFGALFDFEISAARGDVFDPGINTLTFLVNNAGDAANPAGLRVDGIFGWATPLGGLRGDFNGNGQIDLEDIDILTAESASGENRQQYDLTGDGFVDQADVTEWAKSKDIGYTWIGDANFDGQFNTGDFVQVLGIGKYEQPGAKAVWSEGDWNGDGVFGTGDLVAALSDGGYEIGPRTDVAAVPEPSTFVLVLLAGLACLGLRRR